MTKKQKLNELLRELEAAAVDAARPAMNYDEAREQLPISGDNESAVRQHIRNEWEHRQSRLHNIEQDIIDLFGDANHD